MKIDKRLRDWWEGTYVPAENEPDSGVFLLFGSYQRHWTSRLAHVFLDFWLAHWKWIIGVALAIIGLTISALR